MESMLKVGWTERIKALGFYQAINNHGSMLLLHFLPVGILWIWYSMDFQSNPIMQCML